jgi:GT2 family glycosyltransferase
VVIPARNSADTLAEQLAALEGQDYGGTWELIVADNGSTDATRSVAERWRARLPKVRVVDASQVRGVAHARNRGAAFASGEYLLFCDADDVVTPNWMSVLLKAMADADAVGGRRQVMGDSDAAHWRGFGDGYLPAGITPGPSVPGCNLAVRRAVFEALCGFDEHLDCGEDVDFGFRLNVAGYRVRFTNDAVVWYRLRAGLRDTASQAFRYGRAEPHLFRKHRSAGMSRRSFNLVTKSWGWVALNLWRLLLPRERGRWVWIAGKNVGRIVGSVECSVVCL